ncbi:hypothetical protein ACE193_13745 [Bernardetia sp. OM2101]|uniref:hypothetical protein n=1 Tax=Bernardetia sp. OM2101 TaxID=3344876 RepID=UPI0035CF48FD
MKIQTVSSFVFLLFSVFLFSFISTLSFAQRNTNPYKKNKERTIIIDESNVYDGSKDKKRKTLCLKDTISKGDFLEFVNSIKTIKNPSLIDEKSDCRLYSRLFMDTYKKHLTITNGINETIVLAPTDNNKLYLVGKLDNMPKGIHALLFYSFEGTSIQFTKIITFDDAGTPIATKNVQYYIKGSQDGLAQEGKTSCQINSDQTISCINYTEKEGTMTPKSEKIHQIQTDGSILEIGFLELENYLVDNQE